MQIISTGRGRVQRCVVNLVRRRLDYYISYPNVSYVDTLVNVLHWWGDTILV
jgi:hypothetical protein